MTEKNGFTLLEILVALTILGLALGSAMAAIDVATRATADSADQRRAVLAGQSFLDSLGRDEALRDGTRGGDWAGGLHWRLVLAPLPDQPDLGHRVLSAHLATLTIGWQRNGAARQVELRTLLLGPPA